MTIAAGFVCHDGILLCTDSQYTSFQKEYRDKVFSETTGTAGFAFAITGDEDYAKTAFEDVCEAVSKIPHEHQTVWNIRRSMRRSIKSVIQDYNNSGRDPDQRPEFIIAITTQSEARLFSSSDTAFPPEPEYGFRGSGRYIGNYIMQAFGIGLRNRSMTEMLPVALHVVSAAKRQDAFCGGGAQFMVVSGIEARGFFTRLTSQLDDHIINYEHWCGGVLSAISDRTLSDDDFKEIVDGFSSGLLQMKNDLSRKGSEYWSLVNFVDWKPSTPTASPGPQSTKAGQPPPQPLPESPGGSGES